MILKILKIVMGYHLKKKIGLSPKLNVNRGISQNWLNKMKGEKSSSWFQFKISNQKNEGDKNKKIQA